MIKTMYGALVDHLPFDLCHEIVKTSCEFTTTPKDARRYVSAFVRDFDRDVLRVCHSNNVVTGEHVSVVCDPLSRGITDYEDRDIENRILDFPLENLIAPKWKTEYYIDKIGNRSKCDLSDLIVSDFWDIGTCGDGYGQLLSTCHTLERRMSHKWTTILTAEVTNGTVTRNWEEGGNMYLEPSAWFIKIGDEIFPCSPAM